MQCGRTKWAYFTTVCLNAASESTWDYSAILKFSPQRILPAKTFFLAPKVLSWRWPVATCIKYKKAPRLQCGKQKKLYHVTPLRYFSLTIVCARMRQNDVNERWNKRCKTLWILTRMNENKPNDIVFFLSLAAQVEFYVEWLPPKGQWTHIRYTLHIFIPINVLKTMNAAFVQKQKTLFGPSCEFCDS